MAFSQLHQHPPPGNESLIFARTNGESMEDRKRLERESLPVVHKTTMPLSNPAIANQSLRYQQLLSTTDVLISCAAPVPVPSAGFLCFKESVRCLGGFIPKHVGNKRRAWVFYRGKGRASTRSMHFGILLSRRFQEMVEESELAVEQESEKAWHCI